MLKTIACRTFFFALLTFFTSADAGSEPQSGYQATIRRLPPAAFSNLPQQIRSALQARGCTIPQAYDTQAPDNVIRGEFLKRGQYDWAVLCSLNENSSILVFWGGSDIKVSELAPSPEEHWLQGIGDGRYGFSREIFVATKKHIEGYHNFAKQHGGDPDLPPIMHDGIGDYFVNKASVVHYFYKGKWLTLSGSD